MNKRVERIEKIIFKVVGYKLDKLGRVNIAIAIDDEQEKELADLKFGYKTYFDSCKARDVIYSVRELAKKRGW